MEMLQKKPSPESALKAELHARSAAPAQKLPAPILNTAQGLTGYDLNGLRIRYNSALPGEFGSTAMAVGTTILQNRRSEPDTYHEILHIVQNAQGLVHPTRKERGLEICEDPQLERAAEQFSKTALFARVPEAEASALLPLSVTNQIAQFRLFINLSVNRAVITKGTDEPDSTRQAKRPVPLLSDDVFEITVGEPLDLIAQRYVELSGNHVAFEEVQQILLKLATKSVRQSTKDSELLGEEVAFMEAPTYECMYVFADLAHLWDYISFTLEKKRSAQSANTFKINVIHVGQGDAILCTFPGKYLMIDLSDNIQNVIEFLSFKKGGQGIPLESDNLRIILTHGDADHVGFRRDKEGNIQKLNEKLNYDILVGQSRFNALTPEKKKELNQFLGGTFTILEGQTIPDPKYAVNYKQGTKTKVNAKVANSNSLLILHQTPSEVVILTGDLQSEDFAEGSKKSEGIITRLARVLTGIRTKAEAEGKPLPKVVLKVPHHGSHENTNDDLITFIKTHLSDKATLLTSSGDHRTYNHPSHHIFFDTAHSRLYPQGTQLSYMAMELEVYYTGNLENRVGSLVYKSSGTGRAVEYTKVIGKQRQAALSKKKKEIISNNKQTKNSLPFSEGCPISEERFAQALESAPPVNLLIEYPKLEQSDFLIFGWMSDDSFEPYSEEAFDPDNLFPVAPEFLLLQASTSKEESPPPPIQEVEQQLPNPSSELIPLWILQGMSDEASMEQLIENPYSSNYIVSSELERLVRNMPAETKAEYYRALVQEILDKGQSTGLISKLCMLLNVSTFPNNAAQLLCYTFSAPEILIHYTYPNLLLYLGNRFKRVLFSEEAILNETFQWDITQSSPCPDLWMPFAPINLLMDPFQKYIEKAPSMEYVSRIPLDLLAVLVEGLEPKQRASLSESLLMNNIPRYLDFLALASLPLLMAEIQSPFFQNAENQICSIFHEAMENPSQSEISLNLYINIINLIQITRQIGINLINKVLIFITPNDQINQTFEQFTINQMNKLFSDLALILCEFKIKITSKDDFMGALEGCFVSINFIDKIILVLDEECLEEPLEFLITLCANSTFMEPHELNENLRNNSPQDNGDLGGSYNPFIPEKPTDEMLPLFFMEPNMDLVDLDSTFMLMEEIMDERRHHSDIGYKGIVLSRAF